MIAELWRPQGVLAESLDELVECARGDDFSPVLIDPLTDRDVLQTRASRVRLNGDGAIDMDLIMVQYDQPEQSVLAELGVRVGVPNNAGTVASKPESGTTESRSDES